MISRIDNIQHVQTKNYHKTNLCPKVSNNVPFKGHLKIEMTPNEGFEILRHETGFFREYPTLKFVKDYVEKFFKDKDEIRIVSGACSTGEEVVSLGILLNAMKDKVKILGIDVGEKAIDSAKSGKYTFERYKYMHSGSNLSALSDVFLAFKTKNKLSIEQKGLKQLFDKFFEPTDTVFADKIVTEGNKFIAFLNKLLLMPIVKEQKEYKIRDGELRNCEFVLGNITDINEITKGKKSDVILFRNAMYHMATDYFDTVKGKRVLCNSAENIIENLINILKNNLNKNGILCFGEHEGYQLTNDKILPNVLKKLGFEPLNRTPKQEATVWKLKSE